MTDDLSTLPLADLYDLLSRSGLPRRLFELAHDEDLGPSGIDLTASLLGDDPADIVAAVRSRQPGVVAGLAALPDLLDAFGAELEVEVLAADGERCNSGDELVRLIGSADECVRIERTLLNLLSRLSGIATRTAAFVERVAGRAELLDTRKTTPGLRVLEKYAVRCGGGHPHRLGLYDAELVKDNHLASLTRDERASLFASLRSSQGVARFVEIEVDTLEQLTEVLQLPSGLVDFVLLDNMSPPMLASAVGLRERAGSAIRLEASGGVTLETIDAIAATGVDRISVGSLTHQAQSIDLGLDVIERLG